MRGRNCRCRLEQPLSTRTATGGRTRTWPNLPEFGGNLSPLGGTEIAQWERETQTATHQLIVMGRDIPEQHRDKVTFKNRIVVLNRRNPLEETVYDILNVSTSRRAGRLCKFEIILGKIK